MSRFTGLGSVFKREFRSYFSTPLGYIFIVIFLVASGYLTLSRDFGRFLELREASLEPFLEWLPLVFVFLVPAVAMRLWADERKTGTVELLFTLPITLAGSYLGKFLAGWAFLLVALALTWPVVAMAAYLGDPDWGVIFTGYLGAALLGSVFLSIGMLFSAITKNQVVAFILGLAVSAILLILGLPQILEIIGNWLGAYPEQLLGSLSLSDHFDTLAQGLVELRTLVFFVAITVAWLTGGMILLNQVKAS